jgi:hypothetical protein
MHRLILPMTVLLLAGLPATAAQAAPPTGAVVVLEENGSLCLAPADLSGYSCSGRVGTYGTLTGMQGSADGSRLVAAVERYASDTLQGYPTSSSRTVRTSSITLHDVSTRLVRTLDAASATISEGAMQTGRVVSSPAVSPDGDTAVWVTDSGTGTSLRALRASGGSPSDVPGSQGLHAPLVLDDQLRLLALDGQGDLVVLDPSGTTHPSASPDDEISRIGLSNDHTKLVYVDLDGTRLSVADFSLAADGTPVVGTATVLSTSYDSPGSPHFSFDGGTVLWAQQVGRHTHAFTVPTSGGSPVDRTSNDQADVREPLGMSFDTGTAPGPLTPAPAVLLGTSAVLHFTLPADDDLSGVSVSGTSPATQGVYRFVPAPSATFVDSSLAVGETYSYTLTPVDRSGHPAATKLHVTLTATGSSATFFDPTSRGSTSEVFRVGFPTSPTYNVSYRVNGTGPFVRWVTDGTATSLVFGRDAGTTSTAGSSYAFRVQGFDAHGNATPVTNAGTAVVPYDQNALTFVGSTASTGSTVAFKTTERVMRAGSHASITVVGNRLQVLGSTCPTCGALAVFVDSGESPGGGLARGYSSTRHDKVVLFTSYLAPGPHTISLFTRADGGRSDMIIDGLAVRR